MGNTKHYFTRKIVAAIIAVAFVQLSAMAYEDISISVDGVPITWEDTTPYTNSESRTMVPLRAAAEAMDISVTWDGNRGVAVFSKAYGEYELTVEFAPHIYAYTVKDGVHFDETKYMDTATTAINGRIYAPIRYLAEEFGYQVEWDSKTGDIHLIGGGEIPAQRERVTSFVLETSDGTAIQEVFQTARRDNLESFQILFYGEYASPELVDRVLTEKNKERDSGVDHCGCEFTLSHYDSEDGLIYQGKQLNMYQEDGQVREEAAFQEGIELLGSLYTSGVLTDEMSEYEKAEVLFKVLREKVSLVKIDELSYTGWSALKRNNAVCQGMTGAYNMLLRLCGIRCKGQGAFTANGQGHMWTTAILDGVERHIDITWGLFDISREERLRDYPVWNDSVYE